MSILNAGVVQRVGVLSTLSKVDSEDPLGLVVLTLCGRLICGRLTHRHPTLIADWLIPSSYIPDGWLGARPRPSHGHCTTFWFRVDKGQTRRPEYNGPLRCVSSLSVCPRLALTGRCIIRAH